jgi:methionyl-tRNA formyltransferase
MDLKLIFCGTSEFALPALKALLNSRNSVLAVVTKSDQPAGRGLRQKSTPVKVFMEKEFPQVPVLQPINLRDENFLQRLRGFEAEIFVVASFPIMPMKMVRLPYKGCLNIHPSLLPQYRGAAPIRWALINGDTETGITTFLIGEKIDAGNILLQRPTTISPNENYGYLHQRLAEIGAELALESLDLLEKGQITPKLQDESQASMAPKITSEDLKLNWNWDAISVHNRVRAFSPDPGAFTFLNGLRLKIFASATHTNVNLECGKVLIDGHRMFVGCKKGALELLEVQMEGKKRLPMVEFLRGSRFKEMKLD